MGCSRFGVLFLPFLCCAIAAAQGNSTAKYTIAIKSYAPYNTDIFVAARDGSNPRPLVPNSDGGAMGDQFGLRRRSFSKTL